jgi:hypothetical protein
MPEKEPQIYNAENIEIKKDEQIDIKSIEFEQLEKSELQKQIEVYDEEQEHIREFLDKLSDLVYKTEVTGVVDEEIIQNFQRDDIQSDQIKSVIAELREKIKNQYDEISEKTEFVEKNQLPLVEKIEITTDQDFGRLSDAVEVIGNQLVELQKNKRNFENEKMTEDSLVKVYLNKKLAESGFQNFDEVDDKINEYRDQIINLSQERFGKIKNRKEIKELRNKVEPLYNLRHVQWNVHESLPSLSYDTRINKYGSKAMEQSFEKTTRYFQSKVMESTEQEEKSEMIELDPGLIDELNSDYIEQNVRPEIERTIQYLQERKSLDAYNVSISDDLEVLSNIQNQKKVISLIKKSFEVPGQIKKEYGFSEISEERLKIDEEVEKLPFSLKNIVNQFLPRRSSTNTENDNYHLMTKIAGQLPEYYKQKNYKEIGKILHEFTRKDGTPYEIDKYSWETDKISNKVDESETFKQVESALDEDIDIKRWLIFKNNKNTKELLKQGELELIDKVIKDNTLQDLISTDEHTNKSVRLGWKILNFKDTELAPYVIMNCVREPGHSGECPFVRWDVGSQNTELYKYLQSFSQEDINKLKQSDIKGLSKFIELAQESPNNFLTQRITVKEEGKEEVVDNPVYTEVEKSLSQMCLHYIQQDNYQEREFALSLFERLYKAPIDSEMSKELTKALKEKKSIGAVLDVLKSHALDGDLEAGNLLISNWRELNDNTQSAIRAMRPSILGNIIEREIKPDEVEILSDIFQISSEELTNTHTFIRQIKEIFPEIYSYNREIEKVTKYVELAQQREKLIPLINQLKDYGYRFNIDNNEALFEILANQKEVLQGLKEIKKDFSDFQYNLYESDLVKVEDEEELKRIYVTEPYEILTRITDPAQIIGRISEILDEKKEFNQRISQGFMKALRRTDPMLREMPEATEEIPQESYDKFHQSLTKLAQEFKKYKDTGTLKETFFSNRDLQRFIARQPERIDEVLSIPEKTPELLRLMQIGGPLHSNKDKIIENVFSNGDALRRAKEIESIFTKVAPYWKQLFLYTEARIGDRLAAATSEYPVTEIGDIPIQNLVERHIKNKEKDDSKITKLETIVQNQEIIDGLTTGEINAIPFNNLSGVYKRLILREYLKKTIEYSRSAEKKLQADSTNRQFGQSELILSDGDYIHGSPVDAIDPMLLNGNLPNECLGEGAMTDAYPFHVDFTRLGEQHLKQYEDDTEGIITHSLSGGYGAGGSLGTEGQIFYVHKKDFRDWEKNKEYDASSSYHALTLGGMPATEIRGIVLRNSDVTLEQVKKSVLENGFYIPIYNIKGEIIFTPEEYDKNFENNNLKVPVEVWDYSLKTGEQKGSNPGAEFTIPTEKGPTKFYVKFASLETADHIWNEQLADDIYQHFNIPVPDTKIVKVEGTYGHASEMIENIVEGAEIDKKLKDGFIADCLMANWDIPYAPHRNTGGAKGELYRLDNGGSLIFRAKGDRKKEDEFGEVVNELGVGTDKERLKLGSRQQYPGLSEDDIRKQTETLKEKFTDETIDKLVDEVRLTNSDRSYLKDVLKKRRDYIIEKVLS